MRYFGYGSNKEEAIQSLLDSIIFEHDKNAYISEIQTNYDIEYTIITWGEILSKNQAYKITFEERNSVIKACIRT